MMASRDAPLLAICVFRPPQARDFVLPEDRVAAAVCRPRIADALEHRRHDVSAGGMDAFRYFEQAAVRVQISPDDFERRRSGFCSQRLGKLVRNDGRLNRLMHFGGDHTITVCNHVADQAAVFSDVAHGIRIAFFDIAIDPGQWRAPGLCRCTNVGDPQPARPRLTTEAPCRLAIHHDGVDTSDVAIRRLGERHEIAQ